MELQKRNETVWSIKRTAKPGRFLLRAVEESGEYIEFSLGMELDNQKILFDMEKQEFDNFYHILTNFKGLIEGSPNSYSQMAASSSGWAKTPSKVVKSSLGLPAMSLDGGEGPIDLNDEKFSSLDDINKDKSLQSLQELDEAEVFATEYESAATPTPQPTSEPIVIPNTPPLNSPPSPVANPLQSEQNSLPLESSENFEEKFDGSENAEDLLGQISQLANQIQNIPELKPVVVPNSNIPKPAPLPLVKPIVPPPMTVPLPSEELPPTLKPSENEKKKTLKETDWDPW